MTSSPPPEAQHFRGNISPQSPIPVHIPEPQNIPVLQNQTDPVFNLVSTHMELPSNPHDSATTMLSPSEYTQNLESAQVNLNQASDGHDEHTMIRGGAGSSYGGAAIKTESDMIWEQDEPNTLQNQMTLANQQSESLGASDSLFTPTQSNIEPHFQSQSRNPGADDVGGQAAPVDHHAPNAIEKTNSSATFPIADETHPAHIKTEVKQEGDEGVNYQTLLDNLSPSASTAPTADNIASLTTVAPSGVSQVPSPGSSQTPIAAFPTPAGLPPRPPPQDQPLIHPNYTPGQHIGSYHNPSAQSKSGQSPYSSQSSNSQRPPQNYSNGVAPNGMAPPPLATFQQSSSNQSQRSPHTQSGPAKEEPGSNNGRPAPPSHGRGDQYLSQQNHDALYREFLHAEAVYVSEGTWDKFPPGSRVFVGNLFTEKVSKRDLFDIFSKHGRLAQISMKSAYGFVQYIDPGCSVRALQAEEGREVGGRKIHLEISKPQQNKRNAAATAAGDNLRAGYGRRSRSPDYGRGVPMRGPRPGADRFDRGPGPNNSDRRVRDDYRPMRSPSPRGFRGRNDPRGRDMGPDRYYGNRRSRSRSPPNRGGGGRYRSRSPRLRDPEDEANAPMPRRNPDNVPDVQAILLDEVDRTFVGYILQTFRDRGLRCEAFHVIRGVSLAAVINRQIVEGVQAIVKIYRRSQVNSKIHLQLFNRSAGMHNVSWDNYEDLDAHVAADLVLKAKSTHMAPVPPQQFPSQQYQQPPYGAAHYGQPPQQMPPQIPPQHPPQAGGGPQNPNVQNLITALDGPGLQKLLGALNQNPQSPHNPQPPQAYQGLQHPQNPQYPQHPQQPQAPQQPAQNQDLATLLSTVARQQPQQQQRQGYPHQGPPQQQYQQPGAQAPNTNLANNPALAQLLNRPQPGIQPQHGMQPQQGYQQLQGMPPQHQQQQMQQPNVQDVMAQLANYQR